MYHPPLPPIPTPTPTPPSPRPLVTVRCLYTLPIFIFFLKKLKQHPLVPHPTRGPRRHLLQLAVAELILLSCDITHDRGLHTPRGAPAAGARVGHGCEHTAETSTDLNLHDRHRRILLFPSRPPGSGLLTLHPACHLYNLRRTTASSSSVTAAPPRNLRC